MIIPTTISTDVATVVGIVAVVTFQAILCICPAAFMTILIALVIYRRKFKKSKIMIQQLAATVSNQQKEIQENACYRQTEYECIITLHA